jgi:hypothetical protein
MADSDLQQYLAGSPGEVLDRFEASVKNPSTPDRLDEVALGEMMSHGEDIRRALRDRGEHPVAHVAVVGPMYAASKAPLNGKKRAEGLSFRATDSDWTLGSGPEVAGPGIDLILSIVGRTEALDQLEGAGVSALRARS